MSLWFLRMLASFIVIVLLLELVCFTLKIGESLPIESGSFAVGATPSSSSVSSTKPCKVFIVNQKFIRELEFRETTAPETINVKISNKLVQNVVESSRMVILHQNHNVHKSKKWHFFARKVSLTSPSVVKELLQVLDLIVFERI